MHSLFSRKHAHICQSYPVKCQLGQPSLDSTDFVLDTPSDVSTVSQKGIQNTVMRGGRKVRGKNTGKTNVKNKYYAIKDKDCKHKLRKIKKLMALT